MHNTMKSLHTGLQNEMKVTGHGIQSMWLLVVECGGFVLYRRQPRQGNSAQRGGGIEANERENNKTNMSAVRQ